MTTLKDLDKSTSLYATYEHMCKKFKSKEEYLKTIVLNAKEDATGNMYVVIYDAEMCISKLLKFVVRERSPEGAFYTMLTKIEKFESLTNVCIFGWRAIYRYEEYYGFEDGHNLIRDIGSPYHCFSDIQDISLISSDIYCDGLSEQADILNIAKNICSDIDPKKKKWFDMSLYYLDPDFPKLKGDEWIMCRRMFMNPRD